MSSISYTVSVRAPQEPAAKPKDAEHRKHHPEPGSKEFRNHWPSFQDPFGGTSRGAFMLRLLTGRIKFADGSNHSVTVRQPHFLPTRETPKLRSTWLGHACYLIEFPSGLRVLFDPVFEVRCAPTNFFGPKRFTEAPCQIEDLPKIDAVCISHDHYDHLSYPTILRIVARHPDVHFFVPLRTYNWFRNCKIPASNITELDWWEQQELTISPSARSPIPPAEKAAAASKAQLTPITGTFSCVPCQHISSRGPFDSKHTLWCGWTVQSGGANVYFAGDTGYRHVPIDAKENIENEHKAWDDSQSPHCPAFAQIGALRGPFDLGLIPIGAYKPRWLMSSVHAHPIDAVEIFRDTQCRRALAMHWGTWSLTTEEVMEPPKILRTALRHFNLPEVGVFDVCDIGESIEFETSA